MQESAIQWTEATWNPLQAATGESGLRALLCEDLCRALAWDTRPSLRAGFDLRFVAGALGAAIALALTAVIFVNSMSDLFHEGIPSDSCNEFST